MAITQESLYLPLDGYQLHLRHITPEAPSRQPVLMVHGSVENGKIFYTESGKGFAAYLAREGHPVYVLDQRGRGGSLPKIASGDDHGHFEAITADLPAVQAFIGGRHQQQKVHWVAHSWGGVLMASTLARYPELASQVASQVYFGTKRVIHSWSWERFVKVEFFWKRLALLIAKVKGYLPVVELKMGADNETRRSLQDNVAWVTPGPWRDAHDDFDYGAEAKAVNWPPSWLLAAKNDLALGNPQDVLAFAAEMGDSSALEYRLLGKESGHRHDYDHINMLTHRDAADDHFRKLRRF